MIKIALLKVEINGYKKTLEAAVIDLNETNMFLGYNWLIKYNLVVNLKNDTIIFIRCLRNCKMKY